MEKEMKYFTLDELCRSTKATKLGIDNSPNAEAAANLQALVGNILDPLREKWGNPITVTSGYRCSALNRAVKGSASSQHMKGEAADITVGTLADNMHLFRLILSMKLPFDQLIYEYGNRTVGPAWLHVSYSKKRQRGEVLYCRNGHYYREP